MAGDVPQLKDEFSSRALFGFNFNFNTALEAFRAHTMTATTYATTATAMKT